MDDLMSIYIEDMKEYLVILNDSIISLERDPDDKGAVGEMFRAFHTMKSSTAAMEFRKAAGFIHRMEDLLHEIREDRLRINTGIIKLLFRANDLLEHFLDSVIRDGSGEVEDCSAMMEEVDRILDLNPDSPRHGEPADGSAEKDTGLCLDRNSLERLKASVAEGCQAYKLTAVISEKCIFRAVRAWMVLEEASRLSNIIWSYPEKPDAEDFKSGRFVFNDTVVRAVIVSDTASDDLMQEMGMSLSEIENLYIEAIDRDTGLEALFNLAETVFGADGKACADTQDDLSEIIDGIIGTEQEPMAVLADKTDKIGEILVHTGHLNNEDVDEIIKIQQKSHPDLKFGQIAVKEGKADREDVVHALQVQKSMKADAKQAYIRIPASKLDSLADLTGELLITQSLHKQEISGITDAEANKAMNGIMRMERIAKDIQNITMSLRMVSLKQTFQKIYRIGRDTALELGKNVEITISGEDTEIDRTVVEKIHDPLMHLIRNAISHGIEEESERLEKGKTAGGNISIRAYNRRGSVYIIISDDGRGLSPDEIYRKAVHKGLADPSRKYGDDELLKLIYLPGFSTENNVNSISGRGVGMNVVQTEISRLGGKIEIENHPAEGCAFILKIPVNLATIDGTIVDICGSHYIIPTLGIKQIFMPRKEQWIYVRGEPSSIMLRNDILRVIPIGLILKTHIGDGELETSLITVVEHEKRLMALPVKAILGKQEIVVKPLGSDFGDLNFVSGATILGDGKVSLILDVEALFRMADGMDKKYGIA